MTALILAAMVAATNAVVLDLGDIITMKDAHISENLTITEGYYAAVEIAYPDGTGLVVSNGAQTVQVVTNVVTNAAVDHTYYVPLPCPDAKPGDMVSCAVFHCETVNVYSATERDVTTTVKEIRTLRLTWRGKVEAIKRERVLSETVKRLVKRETWEVAK